VIVLDASVLIAHLDASDAHHQTARALLEKTGGEALGASAITLAETFVSPAKAGRLEEVESAVRQLGIEEIVIEADTAGRLATLRAGTRLKMPDCCVLLAAVDREALVASFDESLLVAAQELGLKTLS
jgi:predicted nucleic acid-binding protein